MPERGGGDGLFIVVDLGERETGAVVQGRCGWTGSRLSRFTAGARPQPDPPAATGGDAGELVDVDVDQLARPVVLIATWRINVGGAVAMVEPAKALSVQDRLHRRGSQAELVTDVGCTPPMTGRPGAGRSA